MRNDANMDAFNSMELSFDSRGENEGFARVAVSAFAVQLSPTLETLTDIKTAVSEAVTNCVVHAYRERMGKIRISCRAYPDGRFFVTVQDEGCGIPDIARAMEPFYTTQPECERSGMGFAVMQTFMDQVQVESRVGEGTCVTMMKHVSPVA